MKPVLLAGNRLNRTASGGTEPRDGGRNRRQRRIVDGPPRLRCTGRQFPDLPTDPAEVGEHPVVDLHQRPAARALAGNENEARCGTGLDPPVPTNPTLTPPIPT